MRLATWKRLLGGMAGLLVACTAQASSTFDVCSLNRCRELAPDERKGFGEILAALFKALPAPPPSKFQLLETRAPHGLEGWAVLSHERRQDPSWPADSVDAKALAAAGGAFPRELAVVARYRTPRASAKQGLASLVSVGDSDGPAADLTISISATAFFAFADPSARVLEKNPLLLLSEEASEGLGRLTLILGEHSSEMPAAMSGPPPLTLAPVRAITVTVSGPLSDARVLLKKIDRRALTALLGRPAPRK